MAAASKLAGGIPGFYLFNNLWYHDGTFYLYPNTTVDDMPERDQIMSGPYPLSVGPYEAERHPSQLSKVRYIAGESIFLNDGASGDWSYLNWFYHFAAEALLGGIAALELSKLDNHESARVEDEITVPSLTPHPTQRVSSTSMARGARVPTLIIPWEHKWRDRYGLNAPLVSNMFPGAFIDAGEWSYLNSRNTWVGFERVAFVDRYASHRYNPLAIEWNKMSLPIFSRLPSSLPYFSQYRETLLSFLGLHTPTPRKAVDEKLPENKVPRIVYIELQKSGRHLASTAHEGLLGALKQLEKERKALVSLPHMGEMSFKRQVEAVSNADIILGVHGNGLTHQLWMPQGGIVIELFPPHAFLRDYQVLSQTLGHRHIAVWDDRIYPQLEWETKSGELEPDMLHNGTEIPLNTAFITQLLDDLVRDMSE